MSQEKKEVFAVPFQRYHLKSWFKSFFLGIGIGLAIVVPGISGAAVAIIFGLYEKLLFAIGNIFKHFKTCFAFLVPIILGAIVGFIVGFLGVKYLLELIPFSIVFCFMGLMLGAIPAVLKEVEGVKRGPSHITLLIVGLIIPLVIGGLSIFLSLYQNSPIQAYNVTLNETSDTVKGSLAELKFGSFPWWLFLIFLPIGFVIGVCQVLPGLSATAFLMMIGYFRAFVDSVSFTYWKAYPLIWAIYVIMGIGVLLGFFVTSKVLNKLFSWNKTLVYHLIVGMSIGSIIAMLINPDMYAVYNVWYYSLTSNDSVLVNKIQIDIMLGAPLFIVGLIISRLLLIYGNKGKEN